MIEDYLQEILDLVKIINERTYRIEEKLKVMLEDKGMLK